MNLQQSLIQDPTGDALQRRLTTIAALLNAHRYRFTCERDLQDGLELVLQRAAEPYRRERSLSAPDRPDFLLDDGIAVEVKTRGSISALLRQISRYAGHSTVLALLVVGTPAWIPALPETLHGKPVAGLRLLSSLL